MSSAGESTPGRREHLFRGRRVTIRDLVDAKLLEAGAVLILDRPHAGESLRVTVTENGLLRMPDGRVNRTPSGAIKDLTGKNVDGWYAWRTADDGNLLHTLREQLLEEVSRAESGSEDSDLEVRQDKFLASAVKAAESGSPRQLTVRDLIEIWGASVRNFEVVEQVDADLNNRGLITVPDFRAVTLDAMVTVSLTTQAGSYGVLAAEQGPTADAVTTMRYSLITPDEGAAWDHGLTIGNLPSASKTICSVTPDATFEEAITLMLIEDYSQLAVMSGPRDLKGAVSWKSITKARNANPDAKLSAAILRSDPVPYTADLIETLPLIQDKEFVFVLGVDRSITGIVTLADVVEVYGQMASPFFIIGRIDQRLRRIIEATISLEVVGAVCDPGGRRDLTGFDQLTMGDYRRIFENPECWSRLGWALDRKSFCARLKEIGKIRNNLMHFNNDPLPHDAISMLPNFLNLLQEYGD